MGAYRFLLATILLYIISLSPTRSTRQIVDGRASFSRYNTSNGPEYRLPGEPCNSNEFRWFALEEDPRKFLYCDRRAGKLAVDTCASVNNVPKIFDERFQRCVMPALGKQRAAGLPKSSGYNEPCSQNTDCLDYMYCPAGLCTCVAGYIDRDRACVPAVAPGDSGCSTNRDCQAYWPTTACEQGRCVCQVPDDLTGYVATVSQTAEGVVCIIEQGTTTAVTKSFCPLPIPYTTASTVDWADAGGPAAFLSLAIRTPPIVVCSMTGSNCERSVDDWGDMVLCVPATSHTLTGAAATTMTVTAVCCPNRAHTCMQPKPPQATAGDTRYWYNQASGTCEQFVWDGIQPWANNFKTRDHCLSYCGGICRHGYTQVTNGVAQSCTGCTGNSVQCISVASAGRQLCCSTRNFICGNTGGHTSVATNNVIPGGVPGNVATQPSTQSQSRWRFQGSEGSGQCVQFTYTGWGGDYNNFATQHDCQSVCISAACEQGEPLKDANGNNQPCGRGCPSAYECRNNICCPRKQTVCVQPRRPGTCSQRIIAYWYNSATRDCEQFTFTGCGGNDNNFESYLACVSFCREVKPEPQCIQGMADKDSAGNYYTCSLSGAVSTCRTNYECYFDGYSFGCCPQRAYTCSLNFQVGSACVTPTTRWYYDTTTRSCQTFQYNGCDGNSNNFINRQECERYCGVGGCPFGGEPYREANGATRVCNAQVTCTTGYTCTTVGAGGNSINYCCATRATICQQSPLQGTQCGAQLQRYYYNRASKQCTTFTYFGCGGNENNFATLSQCNNFCGSAACLAGEVAYMDPNANRPLTCNPVLTNACPEGYNCRTNTLNNTNVCCGSSDMGLCPVGEKAYMEAITATVRECQPSVASSCPNNYLCRPNARTGRYYCCATASANICPAGKAVLRNPSTNQPVPCFISTVNSCPSDYSCQTTTAGQSQGYCCTLTAICPNGGEFFADTSTLLPRHCTVQSGFNPCPNGYMCLASNPSTPTAGYCCKGAGISVCLAGQPLLDSGIARKCVPNQSPICPAGYACTPGVGGANVYYCCSTTARQDGCPAGANAFIPPGAVTPQLCSGPVDTTCPAGYTCVLSPTSSRYQCCSGGVQADGCPTGMIAYREPGTSVIRACTFGGNQCPAPYSCQTATTGTLQCCGLTGGCPAPDVAAINPSTGQPLICTSPAGCPTGFQCLQATTGQMTCCGTATAIIPSRCPLAGQTPYIVPGTGQPQTCQVGVQSCPPGYECSNGGSQHICCSSRTPGPAHCWGSCTPGANSKCIRGYKCQQVGGKYACCRTGMAISSMIPTGAACPLGSPLMYPGTQAPVVCHRSSTDTGTCPVGFACTRKLVGENFCCPSAG